MILYSTLHKYLRYLSKPKVSSLEPPKPWQLKNNVMGSPSGAV